MQDQPKLTQKLNTNKLAKKEKKKNKEEPQREWTQPAVYVG